MIGQYPSFLLAIFLHRSLFPSLRLSLLPSFLPVCFRASFLGSFLPSFFPAHWFAALQYQWYIVELINQANLVASRCKWLHNTRASILMFCWFSSPCYEVQIQPHIHPKTGCSCTHCLSVLLGGGRQPMALSGRGVIYRYMVSCDLLGCQFVLGSAYHCH